MGKTPFKIRETDILNAATNILEAIGWTVYRTNNTGIYNPKTGGYFFHGRPGYPDLTALKPGYPVMFVECKSSRGRLSKAQQEFRDIAMQATCIYVIAKKPEDVLAAIKAWQSRMGE